MLKGKLLSPRHTGRRGVGEGNQLRLPVTHCRRGSSIAEGHQALPSHLPTKMENKTGAAGRAADRGGHQHAGVLPVRVHTAGQGTRACHVISQPLFVDHPHSSAPVWPLWAAVHINDLSPRVNCTASIDNHASEWCLLPEQGVLFETGGCLWCVAFGRRH